MLLVRSLALVGSLALAAAAVAAVSQPAATTPQDKKLTVQESIHLKGLSLHVKDATLAEVAAQLKPQLPADFKLGVNSQPNATFTLDGDNFSFWQIIADMNRQSPISYSLPIPYSLNFKSRPYIVSDTFLIVAFATGDPSRFTWYIRFEIHTDPRVRFIQYSYNPLVTKLTDQDGTSLLPLVLDYSPRMTPVMAPTADRAISIHLDKTPNFKGIKDLQATIDFALLEKEKTYTVDLTQPLAPVVTNRGTFAITKSGAGYSLSPVLPARTNPAARGVALAPAATQAAMEALAAKSHADFVAGILPPPERMNVPVSIFDKDHKFLARGYSGAGPTSGRGRAADAGVIAVPDGSTPVTLEITVPETFVPYTLPIEFHNLPAPVPLPADTNGGGGRGA